MFSTGAEDIGDAYKVLAAAINEKKAIQNPTGEIALGLVLDRYQVDKAAAASAQTIEYNIAILKAFLSDLTVSGISPSKIRETTLEMQEKGYSGGYIRRILTTLIAALNHARKDGLLTNVPSIPLPAMPPEKERWLTKAEANRLLDAATTPHIRRYILIALHTGQRKTAILDLQWPQVDLQRRKIDFNPPGRIKTKKARAVVPINNELFEELNAEKVKRGHVIQFKGKGIADVQIAFGKACKRAKLKDVSPHTLRHTCGTWLAQAGVDMWMISGILGHSSSRTTALYLKHSPTHLRSAVDKLLTYSTTKPKKYQKSVNGLKASIKK